MQVFDKNFNLLVQKNRNFAFRYFVFKNQLHHKYCVELESSFKNLDALQKIQAFQTSLQKNQIDIVFIYGLKSFWQTEDFLKNWLKQKRKQKIIILEKDQLLIAAFLQKKKAGFWLKKSQIEIHLLPSKKYQAGFLEFFVFRFFLKRVEFFSAQTEDKNFQAFKQRMQIELMDFSARIIDQLNFPFILENTVENLKFLQKSFNLAYLRNFFLDQPAIICGAGPSLVLEKNRLEKIKKQNRALIIAGGSAIAALCSYGIEPHIAVAIDPNLEEFARLKNVKGDFALYYNLRLNKDALQIFNQNPLVYFQNNSIKLNSWLEKKAKIKVSSINKKLPKNAYSVSLQALAIAEFLGCSPIVLCGMDLAYGKTGLYTPGIITTDQLSSLDLGNLISEQKDKHGTSIRTVLKFQIEAMVFGKYKKQQNINLINATAGGLAIPNVAFQPLEEIEKKYFPECVDENKLVQKFEQTNFLKIAVDKFFKLVQNQQFTEKQMQQHKNLKSAVGELKKSLFRSKKIINAIIASVKKLKDLNQKHKVASKKKSDQLKKIEEQSAFEIAAKNMEDQQMLQEEERKLKVLQWDLEKELAFSLFLGEIRLAICLYIRYFNLPKQKAILVKYQKLKQITCQCYKILTCSAKSFR